jgi:hypothetical protein
VVGTQDFESVTALVGDGIKVGDAISRVASDRGASGLQDSPTDQSSR